MFNAQGSMFNERKVVDYSVAVRNETTRKQTGRCDNMSVMWILKF